MNNTFELFSLTCERNSCILWFLNELKLTYQRLNGFMALFDFIPIVLVSWNKFLLCHTPIKPLLAFKDQISILIVGYMNTWSRGSYQLESEQGSKNMSYPFSIFVFIMFIKFFNVCVNLLLLLLCICDILVKNN
jgi:hypothetical protein